MIESGWRAIVVAVVALALRTSHAAERLYLSNEESGDVSVIDTGTYSEVARVPVGKRPRGIRAVENRIYVALSGSPPAGPHQARGVQPAIADKSADAIGVIDALSLKLVST